MLDLQKQLSFEECKTKDVVICCAGCSIYSDFQKVAKTEVEFLVTLALIAKPLEAEICDSSLDLDPSVLKQK